MSRRRRVLLHSPYSPEECRARLTRAMRLEDRDRFQYFPGPRMARITAEIKKGRYFLVHSGSRRSLQLLLRLQPEGEGPGEGTQVVCYVQTSLDIALSGVAFAIIGVLMVWQDPLMLCLLLALTGAMVYHLGRTGSMLMDFVKDTLAAEEEQDAAGVSG